MFKTERIEYKPGKSPEQKEREEKFFFEKLEDLSAQESLSGEEDAIRQYLVVELQELGLEGKIDEKGNIWVESDSPEGKILLCAHMDKIGEGAKARKQGGEVEGRLDDALGLSLILDVLKKGWRPSVLFTVEEESHQETKDKEGKTVVRWRNPNVLNAGARYAADQMIGGERKKPKLVLVVECSGLGGAGKGPILYQSSKPVEGKDFRSPKGPLKDLVVMFSKSGLGIRVTEGLGNDSIEFTFVPGVGVAALEVPIDAYHSAGETASLGDIEEIREALELVMKNHNQIDSEIEVPAHAQKEKTVIELGHVSNLPHDDSVDLSN